MTVSYLFAEIPEGRPGFFGNDRKLISPESGNEVLDLHTNIFAYRKDNVKPDLCAPSIPSNTGDWKNGAVNKNTYRRQWLRKFADESTSIADLAEKLETDPNYLSSILGANAKRNIGENLARRMERVFGLPHGVTDLPSEGALQLIQAAEGLDDKEISEVVAFIRFKKKRDA